MPLNDNFSKIDTEDSSTEPEGEYRCHCGGPVFHEWPPGS